jgi:hypothetical protein
MPVGDKRMVVGLEEQEWRDALRAQHRSAPDMNAGLLVIDVRGEQKRGEIFRVERKHDALPDRIHRNAGREFRRHREIHPVLLGHVVEFLQTTDIGQDVVVFAPSPK